MAGTQSILIIEDDPSVRQIVAQHLGGHGLTVDTESDGKAGLERALAGNYSLILLDLGLDGMNGLDICRALRKEREELPIIMLTSRDSEVEKVLGLEMGADDYITKPFSIHELTARVRTVLRRSKLTGPAQRGGGDCDYILKFENLSIDLIRRQATMAGKTLPLTAKEFEVLAFLAENAGEPFSREQLLEHVWKVTSPGYADTVGALILRLRRKLEPDPSHPTYILTVRGVGFRFVESHELISHPAPADTKE